MKYVFMETPHNIVMEVIRHAELIVEWFIVCLAKPVMGRNIALNYQVTCWCVRSSKGTTLLMPQNTFNKPEVQQIKVYSR